MIAYEQDLGKEKEFQQSTEGKAKAEFDVGIVQVTYVEYSVGSNGK